MAKRVLVYLFLASVSLAAAPRLAGAAPFGLDQIATRAEELARQPYVDRRGKVPSWMLFPALTYDQWRDIRFRPDESVWRKEGLPFQIQFFHPGLYYDHGVQMNVIDASGVHSLPFSPDYFDYGKNDFADRIPRDVGFAGFRIHAPVKSDGYFDEVIVFLGASYFRAIGKNNVYGLSARAVAVDTVEPSGEEFPSFVEFWLVKPEADAKSLVLYALLDGPSLSGAYRFEVTPGETTKVGVESKLFPRKVINKLGVAALTSMFFFGENSSRRFDDFRPEVHDSDGLLLHFDSGEWLWRPLQNTPRIDSNGFRMHDPLGYGLVQRDRDFASYQDLETHSELRPSAWVEPIGSWGDGRVELVQIPSDTELVDNITAYWVSDERAEPDRSMSFAYTTYWYTDDPSRPPSGKVVSTRTDRGPKKESYRFVIDFAGGSLASLTEEDPPAAEISAGPPDAVGQPFGEHLVKNPSINGWRLTFQVVPTGDKPAELRAYLKHGGDVLTETWSYGLLPEPKR